MNKHTPGPWLVSTDGLRVVGLTEAIESPFPVVVNCTSGYDVMPYAEAKANAKLIAAAPDLLEALKDVLRIIDTSVYHVESYDNPMLNSVQGDCASAREWIRAALAKAGAVMAIPKTEAYLMDEVRAAHNRYDIAMHACAHWDNGAHGDHACCHEVADAEERLNAARRSLQAYRRAKGI